MYENSVSREKQEENEGISVPDIRTNSNVTSIVANHDKFVKRDQIIAQLEAWGSIEILPKNIGV